MIVAKGNETPYTHRATHAHISVPYTGISHLFRSGDFSSVSNELPLWRRPRFEVFWGLCQDPFLFPASAAVLACSRLLSRFAMFCSMSINICCSSSIISDAAYELQLPSGGLYRISKQTTVCSYQMDFYYYTVTIYSSFFFQSSHHSRCNNHLKIKNKINCKDQWFVFLNKWYRLE